MEPYDILNASATLHAPHGALFGMSLWGMIASLFFSMIGVYYLKRGKSETDVPMLISGLALITYCFFVSDTVYILLLGIVLMSAPYIIDRI